MVEEARDPDALYDDATVFRVCIRVLGNGDVQLEGDIYNMDYALQCIDEAKRAVKRHCARNKLKGIIKSPTLKVSKPSDIVYEIDIRCRRNGNMSTAGSIDDEAIAMIILDNGRDAIRAYHKQLDHGKQVLIPGKDTGLHGFLEV